MHFLISKNFADLYRRREPEGQNFSKHKCTLCVMFLVCPFCLGYHKGYFFKKNKILPCEVVGTKHLNKFMRGIYANDALIPSGLALELSNSLRTFIKAYSWQAHQAFVLGLSFFPMVPKIHALHEVSFELKHQARRSAWCTNPAIFTCSLDEDFIGRCATVSRQVSPRLIALRVVQRYLAHVYSIWARG